MNQGKINQPRFWALWMKSGAVGHFSQKEVPPQHAIKPEEKVTVNYREVVRDMVITARTEKETIWENFKRHSLDYAIALNISSSDVAIIEQEVQRRGGTYPSVIDTALGGFLQFDLEDEKFSLSVKHVCGAHYGGTWADFIFAICISQPSLNKAIGGGTTTISVVPEDWHKKIVRHLQNSNEEPRRANNVYQFHRR